VCATKLFLCVHNVFIICLYFLTYIYIKFEIHINVFIVLLAEQIVDANIMNEIYTEYSVMWRLIGLQLGLKSSVLDIIEAEYIELRKRFEVTLTKWMNLAGNNATWGILELAITNANRSDLSIEPLSESKICSCVLTVHIHVLISTVLLHLNVFNSVHRLLHKSALSDYCAIPLVSKIAKIPWIWAIINLDYGSSRSGHCQ